MAPRSKYKVPAFRVPVLPGTGRDPRARLAAQVEPGPSYVPTPEPAPLEIAQARAGLIGQSAGAPGAGPEPTLVHDPGGDAVRQLLPQGFIVLDQLYRKLPQDALYLPTLRPSKPFTFLLGQYQVPKGMHLWLSSYRYGLMLLGGVDAGDMRYAEDGRFAGSISWDLSVDGTRHGRLTYELDPQPIEFARPQPVLASTTVGVPGTTPAANAHQSFEGLGQFGSSALPQDREIQGPHNGNPWTWVVQEGQTVACRCIVFRRLKTPVAAIFARLGGYLLHCQTSSTLIQRMRSR